MTSVFEWLSEDQDTVLRSNTVHISWELHLRNWRGSYLGDFTDLLVLAGSHLSRDATEPVQGRGHLTLSDQLDWKNVLAAPRVRMVDLLTRREYSWDMGLWVFRNPGRSLENDQLWESEVADIVEIMDVQSGVTWVVNRGENIAHAVADIIRSPIRGLPYNLPLIPWETATDVLWPITERSTWIEIANELLESSAHASLYADRTGCLTTYPWKPVESLIPVWRFSDEEEISWLREDCYREAPPATSPNKFIGINRSVDDPVEGSGVHTIDRSAGQRIVPDVFEVSAVDQSSLTALVQRANQDALLQENRLNLRTGMTPVFWHGDVVEVAIPRLGAGTQDDPIRGLVIGWRVEFDEGDMEIIVEVVP